VIVSSEVPQQNSVTKIIAFLDMEPSVLVELDALMMETARMTETSVYFYFFMLAIVGK
jgi:hypothetical protein